MSNTFSAEILTLPDIHLESYPSCDKIDTYETNSGTGLLNVAWLPGALSILSIGDQK